MSLEEWFEYASEFRPQASTVMDVPDWMFFRAMRDVLDALEALHNDTNVTHGRLSPSGVFFDSVGEAAAKNGDAHSPTVVLGTPWRSKPLCRGGTSQPWPEQFLFELGRVLHPFAAGDAFDARVAERLEAVLRATHWFRRATHPWLIAQDLWAVGVIVIRFLCERTGNAGLWNQAACATGQAARAFVQHLLSCLQPQCHAELALLLRLADLLCRDVAALSAEQLVSDDRLGKLRCGVLNPGARFVSTLRQLRREMTDAITAECERQPRYSYTSNDMRCAVHANRRRLVASHRSGARPSEDVSPTTVRGHLPARDESPASGAGGPSAPSSNSCGRCQKEPSDTGSDSSV
mmetsp:Transcript_48373/g.149283  ORF Transcript_48373/g.149283 Transcript_48373/m.149283 type:complete len:348 (+) Transcript_48373:2629-3672(+)